MSLLRDINLRWTEDDDAPDWFWKSNIVEYLFLRELYALKIRTPGVAKINVYCEARAVRYDGDVFDQVTDVHVKARLQGASRLAESKLNEHFLQLLVEGTKTVLAHFQIPVEPIDRIASEIRQRGFLLSIPLGKGAAKRAGTAYSARLRVTSGPRQESCVVLAEVFQGRSSLGSLPVCTVFPSPDIALERFEGLSWKGKTRLLARFTTAGDPDRMLFGRRNFDCDGFAHVQRVDRSRPEPPFYGRKVSFEVDVGSLFTPAA